MLQANVLRVGLLTSGALAIRSLRLVPDVSTARLRRVQENHHRNGLEGPGTLLGPEETDTKTLCGSCVRVFRPLGICSAGLAGWVLACGPVRPPYRIRCFPWVCAGFGVGGGCGLVSVRVLRTA
jgi:hypothetical protein